jgi:hypothetical protein
MNVENKRLYWLAFLLALTLVCQPVDGKAQIASSPKTALLRVPDDGIQPQAVVDSTGIVHLIYYKGDPMAGDIYYVRKDREGTSINKPIRVNSHPGSAIAMGWVRGAQIAIGKGNRAHIIWNGSEKAEPKGAGGSSNPMLYTRLNDTGTAFEPQRNLITWAGGIDGGGALTADSKGSVYVFWHATAGAADEAGQAVFVALSTDEGKTFSREVKANPGLSGACACCGMKAFIDAQGLLYVLYRAAGGNVNRDTMLLISRDKGKSFESKTLAKWKLDACPLTVYSITQSTASGSVLGAWKNQDQVYFAKLNTDGKVLSQPISPSGTGDNRKYPVVVANAKGETLFAWIEGTAWGKGGSLVWQVFDKDNKPVGERGRADGVAAWSLLTAFARPDGRFVLIF